MSGWYEGWTEACHVSARTCIPCTSQSGRPNLQTRPQVPAQRLSSICPGLVLRLSEQTNVNYYSAEQVKPGAIVQIRIYNIHVTDGGSTHVSRRMRRVVK